MKIIKLLLVFVIILGGVVGAFYLIDDRGKNGTSEFEGEWIQFGNNEFPDWESVVNYLLRQEF